MSIIGNLCLFFATIAFVALNSVIYKPPPGGDAAVGYYWTVILLSVAFIGCMIVAVIVTGLKGGYAWISPQAGIRALVVIAGFICSIVAMAVSAVIKHEHGPVPFILQLLSGFAPLVIPLLLVLSHFVLLNKTNATSIFVYKAPLLLVVCLGIIGSSSAAWSWVQAARKNQIARTNEMIRSNNANHQRMLDEIDSCDVMKNMVFMLVFTDANQDMDIRTKAIAKIKTHPRWQQELVIRLQNDWAPEPFTFLASNDVEDPSLFPDAIKAGVLVQAKLIRESIRKSSHPSHFYPGLFSWEVERVLRTVDRFEKSGVDYLPAIKELRAALDEPSDFDKPEFVCKQYLDEWIKKYSTRK